MMYENLFAYLALLACVLAGLIDRAFLQRGKADIHTVKNHGVAGGLIRFSINYVVSCVPIWSRVTYRLVDMNNPTTVIHGRAKPLEILNDKTNSEYLFLPTATLSIGRWRLHVKVESVASRLNFLYRLFPCVTEYSKEIDITSNNYAAPEPASKQLQPHGSIAPQEIVCSDPNGRSASVEVMIHRNGAIYGYLEHREPFVIGSWQLEGVKADDVEFRINRFFSMTSGLDKKRTAGDAAIGWRGFLKGENEMFLMSCKTDFVAFGWINGVSTGILEIKKKGVEGVACSSQLTIT
ncbi:MAG: hypothetical protein ACRCXH_13045, partial [Shewanella sp.]